MNKERLLLGYKSIDDFTGGLLPNDFILLSGLDNSGKTTLACDLALKQAKDNKKVLYISLQYTKETLEKRIKHLKDYSKQINIIHHNLINVLEIAQICKENGDVNLIIVDYLDLIDGAYNYSVFNKERLCYNFKKIAETLNIPIIVVTRLKNDRNSLSNSKLDTNKLLKQKKYLKDMNRYVDYILSIENSHKVIEDIDNITINTFKLTKCRTLFSSTFKLLYDDEQNEYLEKYVDYLDYFSKAYSLGFGMKDAEEYATYWSSI